VAPASWRAARAVRPPMGTPAPMDPVERFQGNHLGGRNEGVESVRTARGRIRPPRGGRPLQRSNREEPLVGQKSENPALREWHTNNLGRLPGLKFMRTL